MATTKTKPTGNTPAVQFRLSADALAQLDRITAHYGLSSRAETVRFLVKNESKKLGNKS